MTESERENTQDPRKILAALKARILRTALTDTLETRSSPKGSESKFHQVLSDTLDSQLHKLRIRLASLPDRLAPDSIRADEAGLKKELAELLPVLNADYDPLSPSYDKTGKRASDLIRMLLYPFYVLLARLIRPVFASQHQFNARLIRTMNNMVALMDLSRHRLQLLMNEQRDMIETRRSELECIRHCLLDLEKTLENAGQEADEFMKLAFLEIYQRLDQIEQYGRSAVEDSESTEST
ncbi:hypothetical protein JXQ70_03050 [bacterium]|nr:hypothetical protein [bacterium]